MSYNIRAENKRSLTSSPITSLPEDVVVDILARVPRRDYPKISLISKYFQSLVSLPEIYSRRSSLDCTEHCLYVLLYNRDNRVDGLYTLRQKEMMDKSLVLVSRLPDMHDDVSFVAVGSRIYVFSGLNSYNIDCTSHTMQHLPRMPVPMSDIFAVVIGGRIYVFGNHGTDQKSPAAMVVFDTETQMWKDGMTKLYDDVSTYESVVVMAGKMYMSNQYKSFVYDLEENKWEVDEVMSSEYWGHNACVVDDVLYFCDRSDKELRAYDPEHKCWGMVKGLDGLSHDQMTQCYWSDISMSNYGGGKLVLVYERVNDICYTEILLERRKGGQIWGKVDQMCDHSLIAGNNSIIETLDVVL